MSTEPQCTLHDAIGRPTIYITAVISGYQALLRHNVHIVHDYKTALTICVQWVCFELESVGIWSKWRHESLGDDKPRFVLEVQTDLGVFVTVIYDHIDLLHTLTHKYAPRPKSKPDPNPELVMPKHYGYF